MHIFGQIFYFNWLDPTEVSVVWSIIGVGEYQIAPVEYGFEENYITPINTALDVYINE